MTIFWTILISLRSLKDVDATRRLFETGNVWPGSRHARLAIVNILSGESEESYRHAHAEAEWIDHYVRTERSDSSSIGRPDRADIAAIPFFLISVGRGNDAARYLNRWYDWYSFEVCELVLGYSNLARSIDAINVTTV